MSNELIEGLLKGSPIIDQWNKDIHTVLHIIFWLLRPEEIHGMMQVKSSSCLWLSDRPDIWTIRKSGGRVFEVSLQLNFQNHSADVYTTKSDVLAPPEFERTQYVFERLPILVGGLEVLFPSLKERWKPFLDAAATIPKIA